MMLKTHYTPHAPEVVTRLHHDNDLVWYRYWTVLGSFIAAATLSNLAHTIWRWTRCRAGAKRRRRWSAEPRVKVAYLPLAVLALWRRETRRRSVVTDALHLGNHGTALLIACYVALNFALVFLKTEGDIDWQAHHCARLAFANLSLVIGLSSKNNVLSWLTGFPYGSLAILHRASGRLVLLLSLIHAAGRTYVNVPSVERGYKDWTPVKWGTAALLCFAWMSASGLRCFRGRVFSTFIITHTLCIIIALVSLCFHRPQVLQWIIAGIAIYALDMIWRTIRLVFNQIVETFGSKSTEPVAWAEQLTDDTMKISIRTRATWTAGAHAYLHLPLISTGGHPFSISSICRPLTQTNNKRPKETRIELLVRIRKGLTRKLHRATLTAPGDIGKDFPAAAPTKKVGGPTPIYAWIEGPYGVMTPIGDDVDVLVLIAGGSGISFTLPIMLDLVRRKRAVATLGADRCARGIPLATERISFVWVIREAEDVKIVEDHLKRALKLAPPNFLSIKVYVTAKNKAIPRQMLSQHILPTDQLALRDALAASAPGSASAPPTAIPTLTPPLIIPPPPRSQSLTDGKPSPSRAPDLDLCSGRPDVARLLEGEICAAAASDRVGVACCGPPRLVRDIETAVVEATLPGKVMRGEARRCLELTIEEFG